MGGWRFAQTGLAALKQRVIGTNLLMAIAAVGAICIGHWEEAAMVIALYAVGVALEGAAMDRTRRSLRDLVDARPAEAIVRCDEGHDHTVPADEVSVGDVMVIRPGARIAADGVIVEGASAVAEAAITGESVPGGKELSARTSFAGSVNGHGALLVRVTALAQNSTLARLLHLVEEAQAQKAPAQAIVERFGRVYTPLVLGGALLLALAGPLLAPQINWTYRALTLLVVACPCALVIATPVAYVSAIARAAKAGVLVKGGAYLEALAGSRQFFFDKTGTLTRGELRVSDVVAATNVLEEDVLTTAAMAETSSEHPVARAVVQAATERGLTIRPASNVQSCTGTRYRCPCKRRRCGRGNVGSVRDARHRGDPNDLIAREQETIRTGKNDTVDSCRKACPGCGCRCRCRSCRVGKCGRYFAKRRRGSCHADR